jgi:DNA mismatch endonuclease (patch repair protein)
MQPGSLREGQVAVVDVFSPEKRRWLMGRVKNRNTDPERIVRSMLHRMGLRFRLHGKKLPGSPDIVLARHRAVVFVHGCFWHGHEGCPRATRPTTNVEFWNKKIDKNIGRDRQARAMLERSGWQVLTVWQCMTKDPDGLRSLLERFFATSG